MYNFSLSFPLDYYGTLNDYDYDDSIGSGPLTSGVFLRVRQLNFNCVRGALDLLGCVWRWRVWKNNKINKKWIFSTSPSRSQYNKNEKNNKCVVTTWTNDTLKVETKRRRKNITNERKIGKNNDQAKIIWLIRNKQRTNENIRTKRQQSHIHSLEHTHTHISTNTNKSQCKHLLFTYATPS